MQGVFIFIIIISNSRQQFGTWANTAGCVLVDAGMREVPWARGSGRVRLAIGKLRLCDSSSLLIPPLFLWLGQWEINGLKENAARWFTSTSACVSERWLWSPFYRIPKHLFLVYCKRIFSEEELRTKTSGSSILHDCLFLLLVMEFRIFVSNDRVSPIKERFDLPAKVFYSVFHFFSWTAASGSLRFHVTVELQLPPIMTQKSIIASELLE